MRVSMIAWLAVPVLCAGTLLAAGASEGKAVYDQRCKSCHGADGNGNPMIAKMMKVEIPPLGSSKVQSKTDAQLKNDISHGVGKMKPVSLTPAQLNDVVAYIRTLKK